MHILCCMHLKNALKSIKKCRGLSPASVALPDADMSIIKKTKIDVKHQSIIFDCVNNAGQWLIHSVLFISGGPVMMVICNDI